MASGLYTQARTYTHYTCTHTQPLTHMHVHTHSLTPTHTTRAHMRKRKKVEDRRNETMKNRREWYTTEQQKESINQDGKVKHKNWSCQQS